MTKIKSFDEFQPLALRTESRIDSVKTHKEFLRALLVVMTSSGELLDYFKKQIFYGNATKLLENYEFKVNDIVNAARVLQSYQLRPDTLEDELAIHPRVAHGLIGVATEASELLEVLDSGINGRGIDRTNVLEELSDCLWYHAILDDSLELDHYQGLTNVIHKLRKRYPDKFTAENALNRDLDAERKELEVGVVELDSRKKYNESMGITNGTDHSDREFTKD